jgi:hypothetical protein
MNVVARGKEIPNILDVMRRNICDYYSFNWAAYESVHDKLSMLYEHK